MDSKTALTALLVASHPARLEILNYLRKGDKSLRTIQSALYQNENVRKHIGSDEDDHVRACIALFLTDLEDHGLVESEMRPIYTYTHYIYSAGSNTLNVQDWHTGMNTTSGSYTWPHSGCAERYYWLTELGEHALNLLKTYLGLAKWIE